MYLCASARLKCNPAFKPFFPLPFSSGAQKRLEDSGCLIPTFFGLFDVSKRELREESVCAPVAKCPEKKLFFK